MVTRKKAATIVVAALGVIGLALPGTAAARSYSTYVGTQNTSMIVNVSTDSTSASTTSTVSWGDVSWADASVVTG